MHANTEPFLFAGSNSHNLVQEIKTQKPTLAGTGVTDIGKRINGCMDYWRSSSLELATDGKEWARIQWMVEESNG